MHTTVSKSFGLSWRNGPDTDVDTKKDKLHSWSWQAAAAPTCQFDKKFEGLSGNSARTQKEQQSTAEITQHDKYMQDWGSKQKPVLGLESEKKCLSLQFRVYLHSVLFLSRCPCLACSYTNNPETKERLTKFLESIMNKSGKLRSLIRELSTKYSDAAAASFLWPDLFFKYIYIDFFPDANPSLLSLRICSCRFHYSSTKVSNMINSSAL